MRIIKQYRTYVYARPYVPIYILSHIMKCVITKLLQLQNKCSVLTKLAVIGKIIPCILWLCHHIAIVTRIICLILSCGSASVSLALGYFNPRAHVGSD